MEKYLIFEKTSESNREYVYQIGRSNIYTSDDIGNAIEFNNKETALMVAKYLTDRNKHSKKFFVLSMVTKIDVIESEEK